MSQTFASAEEAVVEQTTAQMGTAQNKQRMSHHHDMTFEMC
jgi:hypothetical protein